MNVVGKKTNRLVEEMVEDNTNDEHDALGCYRRVRVNTRSTTLVERLDLLVDNQTKDASSCHRPASHRELLEDLKTEKKLHGCRLGGSRGGPHARRRATHAKRQKRV